MFAGGFLGLAAGGLADDSRKPAAPSAARSNGQAGVQAADLLGVVDRIQIEGLARTRSDAAAAVIGLQPGGVLTTRSLALAERRLAQLPTLSSASVIHRPSVGGRQDIVASVGERDLMDRWPVLFLRFAIEGAIRKQLDFAINSPTRRGERVEVGGRFAANRPAAWLLIETPRLFGLPGVIALQALWDRQTYRPAALPPGAPAPVENRRRGSAGWSHWTTPSAQVNLEAGVDRFADLGTFASLRLGMQTRTAKDRLALLGDVAEWAPMSGAKSFREVGGSLVFRSRVNADGPALHARFDARGATRDAPLALWPGAGTGPGRPYSFRGSKLHRDGEISGDAFGRRLLHASVEIERPLFARGSARTGLAAFADWVRVWDPPLESGPKPGLWALGVGFRVRTGLAAFRVDLARRTDRKGFVVSGKGIRTWPQ